MRITSRQLRQIIREELIREAAPVTSNPAVMQYMKQTGVGEGYSEKTAELYGLLKRVGDESDPKVLDAALRSVANTKVCLAMSSTPPMVVGVEIILSKLAAPGDPKYIARYKTTADGTVGAFALQRVLPDGTLIFVAFDRTGAKKTQKTILTLAQTIQYLENCIMLGQTLLAVQDEISNERGRVYDMCLNAARRSGISLEDIKGFFGYPADELLQTVCFMADPQGAQYADEFFTSY
jgi:hypothetical protein